MESRYDKGAGVSAEPVIECSVAGTRINVVSCRAFIDQVQQWSMRGESRYACFANVHMVMEAHDSEKFSFVVNAADLVAPDGMPLVWALRMFGVSNVDRLYGPGMTLSLLEVVNRTGIPVGFYGSSPETLDQLVAVCRDKFPLLHIPYAYSPPFRTLSALESENILAEINKSGVRILFVGLGCPKQEQWMADHRGKIHAVMLGVGAAFDFISGMKPHAPGWMQRAGLEWLFRLLCEPRRLLWRYLKHNPRFIYLLLRQKLAMRGK